MTSCKLDLDPAPTSSSPPPAEAAADQNQPAASSSVEPVAVDGKVPNYFEEPSFLYDPAVVIYVSVRPKLLCD